MVISLFAGRPFEEWSETDKMSHAFELGQELLLDFQAQILECRVQQYSRKNHGQIV